MRKPKPLGSGLDARRPAREASEADGVVRLMERKPLGSSATGPPAGSESTSESTVMMAGSARRVKTRGRLNRAVLAMLGKGLEDCFEEVRKQEVPERFKLLLRQF